MRRQSSWFWTTKEYPHSVEDDECQKLPEWPTQIKAHAQEGHIGVAWTPKVVHPLDDCAVGFITFALSVCGVLCQMGPQSAI